LDTGPLAGATPQITFREIGIHIFESSSGAEESARSRTASCNASGLDEMFIQEGNWLLTSSDIEQVVELANLAQTQVVAVPNC
jgi:hypothetical protein